MIGYLNLHLKIFWVIKTVKLTLIQGDSLKVMKKMPDESVDTIITDPPYNISQEGKNLSRKRLNSTMFKRNSDVVLDFGEWDKKTEEDFYGFTKNWFAETARVLKEGGWFASFFSKERIGWFTCPIRGLFKEFGFKTRTIITWHKTNPTPSFRKMNFLSSTEFIVVGSKGASRIPNFLQQKEMHNFFETPNGSSWKATNHPTEKSPDLLKWLVSTMSNEGDTILDPFLGSGTTMKASLELNRNCIGIEIEPKYIQITKDRLNWGSSLNPDVQFEFLTEEDVLSSKKGE